MRTPYVVLMVANATENHHFRALSLKCVTERRRFDDFDFKKMIRQQDHPHGQSDWKVFLCQGTVKRIRKKWLSSWIVNYMPITFWAGTNILLI